jgi:uncharacterized protein (TIGR00255 family)
VIRSMTGFGRAELERRGRTLVAEVRSVNHRFLEVSPRLPRGLQPFEDKLRSILAERMNRGKVNLTVTWKGGSEEGGVLSVDMDVAQRYVDILQEVRARFAFRDPVTLGQLMGLPDVIRWSEPDLDPDEAWEYLKEAVGRAVDDLVAMRESEGEALRRDLLARMKTIRTSLAAVESRAPARVKEAKERLHARITELLQGEAQVDQDRLLVEAAFQADRLDCTEEAVRLRSHVDQFEALLTEGGPVGRKLNFLTQEMNREANTIGSKANDVEIARHVIQLKEDIEILREQIQNLE